MSPRANSRADRILRLAVVARPLSNAECRTTTVERSRQTFFLTTFYILPSTSRYAVSGRRRRTCSPIATDVPKIDSTGITPRSRCRPTAARPAEARQPQLLQSGAPPNWQGVILVFRSAEIVVVERANRQSSGD